MFRLLLYFLLLFPVLASAQTVGRISGRVATPTGQPLEGITIVEQTGRFSALTGPDGRFSFGELPLAEYTLVTRSAERKPLIRATTASWGRARLPPLSTCRSRFPP
jgi:iron complex outermembrane receptor protein